MALSRNLLHEASCWIGQKFGINLPPESWPHLEQQIRFAAEECGMQGRTDDYVAKWLRGALSAAEMEALVAQLTVGETYFFREMQSLHAMTQLIARRQVVQGIGDNRTLRIWSAGCSTGEEPYSIAMMIDGIAARVLGRVEIFATDISACALHKARAASYGKWSFRGTPEWVREFYFHSTEKDMWTLDGRVRGCVTFQQANLVDADRFPADGDETFDFIFCRNVLMYLSANAIENAVRNFQRALAMGGCLIVGLSETIPLLAAEFETVHLGGATIYRKQPYEVESAAENYFEDEQKIALATVEHAQVVSKVTDFPIPAARVQGRSSIFKGRSVECKKPARPLPQQTQTAVRMDGEPETKGTDALLANAKELAGRGDLPTALARCEEAIFRDNTICAAHFLRAKIMEEQGRHEEAMESLRRVVYLQPDFVLAHFSLASLSEKTDRTQESGRHIRNVVRLLEGLAPDEIVPHSEGLTAAGLRSLVVSLRLDIVRQSQPKTLPKEKTVALALPPSL